MWLIILIFKCIDENGELSRSQAVTYTANVACFGNGTRLRETFALQPPNRKLRRPTSLIPTRSRSCSYCKYFQMGFTWIVDHTRRVTMLLQRGDGFGEIGTVSRPRWLWAYAMSRMTASIDKFCCARGAHGGAYRLCHAVEPNRILFPFYYFCLFLPLIGYMSVAYRPKTGRNKQAEPLAIMSHNRCHLHIYRYCS